MKTIFKNILFLVITCTFSLGAFVSCDDDDDKGGSLPEVSYIRIVDAQKSDSLIVSADMGSTIAIMGKNFSDVTQIWFNDQKAKLNQLYINDNNILVSIPSEIPEEKTDKIRLVTRNGNEVIYDFEVTVPAPSLTSLLCEYVADGDIAVIYGDYFVEPKVYFPGNMLAEIEEFTKTEIRVIVPEGALPGQLTVESVYGTTRSQFMFRDNSSINPNTTLFLDFTDLSWNNWNRGTYATEGGIDGQYLKFEGSAGSWAWPADGLQLYFNNPNRTPIVSDGDIANMALRFECNSVEWHNTSIMMWFSNKSEVHSVDEDEPQAHWKPFLVNGVSTNYVTNGWVTVTIPLSEFKYDKEESTERAITNFSELVDFHAMVFGPADEVTPINVSMDNFRIVKYK